MSDIEDIDDITEENDAQDDTFNPADVEDVVLYTVDWSVESLLDRIGRTFNINPSFQRRDAWNAQQKSRFIESLVLGLPVPQIVLAEDGKTKGNFLVLDGKQRLVTLKQFAAPNAKFPALRLRKPEFLGELDKMSFDDMRGSLTAGDYVSNFLSQPIRTVVVRNWNSAAVLYQIFVRLNQGSLPLSPQELRQALYPGPFAAWVNSRSASSKLIQAARRLKREDFRMRDAEMLLRSIAFLDDLESYRGNLRQYLDDMCSRGNQEWSTRREEFESEADRTETGIRRVQSIFGERDSFLRFHDGKYIRRFNVAVFDMMVFVLASEELDEVDLEDVGPGIRSGYEDLCSSNREFQQILVSTTKTPRATARRIQLFGEVVESVTGRQMRGTARAGTLLSQVSN